MTYAEKRRIKEISLKKQFRLKLQEARKGFLQEKSTAQKEIQALKDFVERIKLLNVSYLLIRDFETQIYAFMHFIRRAKNESK